MAATTEARDLTELHRQTQLRLQAATVVDVARLTALLDLEDLDATLAPWLGAALEVVDQRRRTATQYAGGYVQAFRGMEIGDADIQVRAAAARPRDAVATSLLVTGPGLARRLAGTLTGEALARRVAASTAAAAARHVANGARDTIINTVQADRQALGWARVTDGNPCAFCAMLAARGPVYSSTSGEFQAHDGCGCGAEPVYRDDGAWPGRSAEWARLYEDAAKGESNPIAAFRRAYSAVQTAA